MRWLNEDNSGKVDLQFPCDWFKNVFGSLALDVEKATRSCWYWFTLCLNTATAANVVDDIFIFCDRGHGENRLSPLLRSPGRGSRCTTTAISPLHARLSGMNLDSPAAKLEDGKSERHRLPLPPGSPPPASPSALPTPRSPGITESSSCNSSKWRKGRLLGRGTFGHVYLGFNR